MTVLSAKHDCIICKTVEYLWITDNIYSKCLFLSRNNVQNTTYFCYFWIHFLFKITFSNKIKHLKYFNWISTYVLSRQWLPKEQKITSTKYSMSGLDTVLSTGF